MANEYEWLDTYENPRRMVTVRDEVAGWVVSAIVVGGRPAMTMLVSLTRYWILSSRNTKWTARVSMPSE